MTYIVSSGALNSTHPLTPACALIDFHAFFVTEDEVSIGSIFMKHDIYLHIMGDLSYWRHINDLYNFLFVMQKNYESCMLPT